MKNLLHLDEKYLKISFYASLVLISAILFEKITGNMSTIFSSIYSFFVAVLTILSPFLFGILIAYILNPGVKWLECNFFSKNKKWQNRPKLKRILSIAIIYIVILGFLNIVLIFGLPQIAKSITDLIKEIPHYIESIQYEIDTLSLKYPELQKYDIDTIINDYVNPVLIKWSQNIDGLTTSFLGSVLKFASSLGRLLLGFVISFYILNDKEKFKLQSKKLMQSILTVKMYKKIHPTMNDANIIFTKFFVGKIIDSIIIGIICFVGLVILKNPYALLLSAIVGITNMIPYFGPFIGAVPAIFITLLKSPLDALWVGIFIIALQQFDGSILGPKILGDSTGLSPFWVIFAITVGGALFGLIGMFLGVPFFAVLLTLIRGFLDKKWSEKYNN